MCIWIFLLRHTASVFEFRTRVPLRKEGHEEGINIRKDQARASELKLRGKYYDISKRNFGNHILELYL